jgi:hypothetical protein
MSARASWRWPLVCAAAAVSGGLLVIYGAGFTRVLGVPLVLFGAGPFSLLVGPLLLVVFTLLDKVNAADSPAVGVPIVMLALGVPGIAWGLTLGEVAKRFRERRTSDN